MNEHRHGDPFERYCDGCFDLLMGLTDSHLVLAERAADAANAEADTSQDLRADRDRWKAIAERLAGALEKWGHDVNTDDCDRGIVMCRDQYPAPDERKWWCRVCDSRAALAEYESALRDRQKDQ